MSVLGRRYILHIRIQRGLESRQLASQLLATKQTKETEDRIINIYIHICIQREVISTTSPSPRDWSNNKFSYIYPTLPGTYIQYLSLTNIISYTMDAWSTQYSPSSAITCSRKNAPIPLELLGDDLVLGVHPASETSNLKKGVNT